MVEETKECKQEGRGHDFNCKEVVNVEFEEVEVEEVDGRVVEGGCVTLNTSLTVLLTAALFMSFRELPRLDKSW